jgi:predicted nuclease of predicted toxin-antitoxin system
MKPAILIDENLPFEFIAFFQDRNCEAYHIKKLGKSGIANGEVYRLAEELSAWIVTRDKDFQNMEKFLRSGVEVIIVLKVKNTSVSSLLKTMETLFATSAFTSSKSRLVIVEEYEVRILYRNPEDTV